MIKAYYVGETDIDCWFKPLKPINLLVLNRKHGQQCVSFWQVGRGRSRVKGKDWTTGASSVWRWLKVTAGDWQPIQKKRGKTGGKMRSEEHNQKPQPLIWVIAQKFGSQKTWTSCCFSNAKMVSFMDLHWENLSKWMRNRALIKPESWQTCLNRKMCRISTLGKQAVQWIRRWLKVQMLQQPAANHVSDNSYRASALSCICPERCRKKETSGIPTTIYYPSDFCAVFTTNSTLRSAACYFSLWLSGRLVFTNTFFPLCSEDARIMTVPQNEIIN